MCYSRLKHTYMWSRKNIIQRDYKREKYYKGICCFDVDQTLTCGEKSNLFRAIDKCKKENHALAIVTARSETFGVPDFKNLGIPVETKVKYGKLKNWLFPNKTAKLKSEQLEELRNEFNKSQSYKIEKKDVYLFDDNKHNVNMVNKHGFKGIHIPNCNLSKEIVSKALKS